MKKDKAHNDEKQKSEGLAENDVSSSSEEITADNAFNEASQNESQKAVEQLQEKLDAKSKQCDEYFNALQRTMAEFDNFKKRTAREKIDLYTDAVSDVIGSILPVLDNFERALQTANGDENNVSLKEGISLVYRQFKDVFKSIGVDEIKGAGENFDPNLHNAVMHVTDDSYGENVVVEEFQKGYIYKEKVIRHSMVKVAN